MKIVLATRNKGKIKEIRDILKGAPVEFLTLEDFPSVTLPHEDGLTFLENALKKASFVSKETSLPALADDSGLEVDSLGGAPGVRSARYAGEGATDEDNVERLLKELKGVAPGKRGARFRCVAALVLPSGEERAFEGTIEGMITTEPRGEGGFGYDPVFLIPGKGKTAAELSPEEKNALSHRGKAFNKFRGWLEGRRGAP